MSAEIPRRTFLGSMAATLLAGACAENAQDAPDPQTGNGSDSSEPNTENGTRALHANNEADGISSSSIDAKHERIPRRKLGRTGVSVSMVGLGGWHMAVPKDESESIRIVHAALERGIDFLDNCWDYHDGEAERRMGKALRGGRREKAFLMTKLDGRTKTSALGQLEQSLRRLGTDRIDLVQIHEVIRDSDPERAFKEGGVEALVEARKAGKLRFIGFTGHKDPSIHLKMLQIADAYDFRFDTVQMPLNVMDAHFRSFEHRVLPVLLRKGIGVLGMKSTGNGVILQSGVVNARECLRYAMTLPTSVVIAGCDSMPILDQAIHAARSFQPMTRSEIRELLTRTRAAAMTGKYEVFKTTEELDATTTHPWWLDTDCIKEDCSE
ncbi:aldo/keto reductase [Pendulispora albinea]|uniref:Aldo/keto reductase n=1 Tax=Pendulispora albinea TaxID=2741071 RepID=A0ABZ2LNB5_9BACT